MVLLNGIETSQTSAHDRGLLYGQSVFETIAINQGKLCLLDLHLKRLSLGCEALSIPFELAQLNNDLALLKDHIERIELIGKEAKPERFSKAVLRITLTMGEGGRGYLNPETPKANRILSLHDYPNHPEANWTEGIKLGLSTIKLASQPLLAGIKHGNRLEQVLARQQWHASWQEALLCDYNGNIIEATQSNAFLVKDGVLKTPDLSHAGVAGIMREFILLQAKKLGVSVQIVPLSVADFLHADEVFISNSVIGIWPVKQFQHSEFTQFTVTNVLLKSIINNDVIPNF